MALNFITCQSCGTSNLADRSVCRSCGGNLSGFTPPKRSRRTISQVVGLPQDRRVRIAVGSLVLAVFAFLAARYAYQTYQNHLLSTKLEEALGRDAGYTETVLKVEADSPNITFKELFELFDKSIEGRTNLIIELRGLYPNIQSLLKDNIIEFLNSENELTRSKKSVYELARV